MMTKRPMPLILALGVLALLCSCERHAPSYSADETERSGATNETNLAESPVDKEVAVYTPRIEDFRTAYDSDLENQRIQTWEEYWTWVEKFYNGTFLLNGWVKSTEQCMAVVTIPDRRRNLAKTMNELGLFVCREWAKDKTIGTITTNDLTVWGTSLRSASESDSGDGTVLLHAVESVLRDATQKCAEKRPNNGTRLPP